MRIVTRRRLPITGAALRGPALVAAAAGVGYLATIDMDRLDGAVKLDGTIALNAFVAVGQDGRIVVAAPRTEMGQGIHTGLAMLASEELDVPLAALTVEHPVEELAV